LSADVVLREPCLVARLLTADPARHQAVRRALDEVTHPAVHVNAGMVFPIAYRSFITGK